MIPIRMWLLLPLADHARRYSSNNRIGRHVPGDHAARADYCAGPDAAPCEYHCPRPNQNILTDVGGFVRSALIYDKSVALFDVPVGAQYGDIRRNANMVTDHQILVTGRDMIEAADRTVGADGYPAGVIDDDGIWLHHGSTSEGNAIAQLDACMGADQTAVAQVE